MYRRNKKWGVSADPFIVTGQKSVTSAGIFWKIFDLSSTSFGSFLICIAISKSKRNNFVLTSHVFFELWNVAVIYILTEESSSMEL